MVGPEWNIHINPVKVVIVQTPAPSKFVGSLPHFVGLRIIIEIYTVKVVNCTQRKKISL